MRQLLATTDGWDINAWLAKEFEVMLRKPTEIAYSFYTRSCTRETKPMSEEIDPFPNESAEKELQKHERRTAQGLDYFPFKDSLGIFKKLGPEADYTKDDSDEVLRIVSSWYVKKNNAYHDVENLQVKYQPHDIKQVIVQRMVETFPLWQLSDQG